MDKGSGPLDQRSTKQLKSDLVETSFGEGIRLRRSRKPGQNHPGFLR